MSSVQVLEALDILTDHQELKEYIKSFNTPRCFMFNDESNSERKNLSKRLYKLLDPHGFHSGSSWGQMIRNVQDVLNEVITRDYIIEKIADEKRKRDELDWKEHYAFIKQRQETIEVSGNLANNDQYFHIDSK